MNASTTFGSHFGQVAWVVKDIKVAEKFFQEVFGTANFVKMENIRAEEVEGTYNGKPGNYSFHLYLSYSGGSMLELIQPVSGQSMYQDFIDKHPQGGVQHIAYLVSEAELDKSISELQNRGFRIIQSLTLPVARVAYFDTYEEIGVVTEIIGLTDAGVEFMSQLKSGSA